MDSDLLGLRLSGEEALGILALAHASVILMKKLLFFHLKGEAIFALHRPANIVDRDTFTLKIHGATSMRKMLIPCDVIMYAFIASNFHSNFA